jgi:hypothetical protein
MDGWTGAWFGCLFVLTVFSFAVCLEFYCVVYLVGYLAGRLIYL